MTLRVKRYGMSECAASVSEEPAAPPHRAVGHTLEETMPSNYGGWSEGDVRQYLERFGEVSNSPLRVFEPGFQALRWVDWIVTSGLMCRFGVRFVDDEPVNRWRVQVHVNASCAADVPAEIHATLPDAMRWAVERWRELVAESDPMPQEVEPVKPAEVEKVTRHIGTGNMGPAGVR